MTATLRGARLRGVFWSFVHMEHIITQRPVHVALSVRLRLTLIANPTGCRRTAEAVRHKHGCGVGHWGPTSGRVRFGVQPRLDLNRLAAAGDRPHHLDRVAADTIELVVEIHDRVAVRHDDL